MRGTADQAPAVDLEALEQRLIGRGSPFELTEKPDGMRSFVSGPHSLPQVYARARRSGAAKLLAAGARSYSYEDIFERSDRLAAVAGRASGPVRRIGLTARDPAEWIAGFIAVTGGGWTAVLIPADAPSDRISDYLKQADCYDILGETDIENVGSRAATRGRPGEDCSPGGCDPDREAVILFTSGTTGAPKGIVHSHGSLLAGMRSMMLSGAIAGYMAPRAAPAGEAGPRQASATLVLTPLSYVAGCSAVLLAMMTGGCLVLAEDPNDPVHVAKLVHSHRVQSIVGLSLELFRRLVQLPEAPELLASLKRLQVHGGRIPVTFCEEVSRTLPELQLMTGYGLSETSGALASAPVRRIAGPPNSAARLSPLVDLRVVDAADAPTAAGETGLLQVRGPMLMQRYTDDARTLRGFTADGWFRTGDVGRLLPGRWLEVIDRESELLASDGRSLAVVAMEAAARALPQVDDWFAFTDRAGELALFARARHGEIDHDALATTVAGDIDWQGPVRVHALPAFPRTASGKIDIARLKALAR